MQGTLDELGTPLSQVTFVVVDLETTGGSAAECGITEVGAVKVRGGEVLGEFQTLVHPGQSIPAFIALLTGISDPMVAAAPRLASVLPAFLEFSAGCVLVAHNAAFDMSFLRAACERTGHPWPRPTVVDTVLLARQLLPREEVRDHKLSSLARHFGSPTTPDHRALTDARATVDVLHALLGRVGNLGVQSLEELVTFTSRVRPATRRKRHLAESLPQAPGVYLFKDDRGRPLYVGTSVDIRARVRSYFTASEQRSRMGEMVALATSVTPVVCATPLEAQVRELRLIAEHAPSFNRRSKHPERAAWVALTEEPFPRLSVSRRPGTTAVLGPFRGAAQARLAIAALHETYALRQCSGRLPARPRPGASACLLADLGRCGAPCVGGQSRGEYDGVVHKVRQAIVGASSAVVRACLDRAAAMSRQERYEEAAGHRDRLLAFLRGAGRAQRLSALTAIPELVAATRSPTGGWELVLVRHGRFAGTWVTGPREDARAAAQMLRDSGDVVLTGPGGDPGLPGVAALPEETELVAAWLEQPGVRLVDLAAGHGWSCPVDGALGARLRVDPEAAARAGAVPVRFSEGRWPMVPTRAG